MRSKRDVTKKRKGNVTKKKVSKINSPKKQKLQSAPAKEATLQPAGSEEEKLKSPPGEEIKLQSIKEHSVQETVYYPMLTFYISEAEMEEFNSNLVALVLRNINAHFNKNGYEKYFNNSDEAEKAYGSVNLRGDWLSFVKTRKMTEEEKATENDLISIHPSKRLLVLDKSRDATELESARSTKGYLAPKLKEALFKQQKEAFVMGLPFKSKEKKDYRPLEMFAGDEIYDKNSLREIFGFLAPPTPKKELSTGLKVFYAVPQVSRSVITDETLKEKKTLELLAQQINEAKLQPFFIYDSALTEGWVNYKRKSFCVIEADYHEKIESQHIKTTYLTEKGGTSVWIKCNKNKIANNNPFYETPGVSTKTVENTEAPIKRVKKSS